MYNWGPRLFPILTEVHTCSTKTPADRSQYLAYQPYTPMLHTIYPIMMTFTLIGWAGGSQPGGLNGPHSIDTVFWSPWTPVLCAKVKLARSHPILGRTGKDWASWTSLHCTWYKQALASMLQLTIRTTAVPYLVNTQSAATICCIATRSKG